MQRSVSTLNHQQAQFQPMGHATQMSQNTTQLVEISAQTGHLNDAASSPNGGSRMPSSSIPMPPNGGGSGCSGLVGCLDFSFLGHGGQQHNSGKLFQGHVGSGPAWDISSQNHRSSGSVMAWGPEQVRDWLTTLGMKCHGETFSSYGVTGEQLLELGKSGEKLKELGVRESSERALLKKKIKELKRELDRERKAARKEVEAASPKR
ncbi:hypothetical protein BIW11_04319 [Tropilaelaps mercedesae]|uniref:SAM domain-containing protein n=1 Tax=Tropilaelaps mercedesae TaxID=418985 RepID=A0A1V9X800_9ACAR|nr:hypothetical protein BIW11_04319 [Tropilaelaps mercedesae]